MSARYGPYARLTALGDGVLLLRSAYSPELNQALKTRLPSHGRRWDPDAKGWRISTQYGRMVADFCTAYLGVTPTIPTAVVSATPPPRETRLFEVRYLGKAKERSGGEWSASGWVRAPQPGLPATERGRGGWDLTVSLRALRRFFEPSYRRRDPGDDDDESPAPAAAAAPPTLYDVLGVPQDADEAALKAGYRAIARQWHPDVCKEPDAHEKFIAIQDAYDTLRDPAQRRRYDRGLQLEQQAATAIGDVAPAVTPLAAIGIGTYGWSPPRRAGFFLVQGRPAVRGFRATNILGVEDIVDAQGLVLLSSWPLGGDDFEEDWAPP
jgi:hypothetical protein